jgi:ATP-binding cassette, subfamily B, bacterial MsbA
MSTLKRLVGYLRPYLGRMVLGALFLTLAGGLMAFVIATIKPLVDRVLMPSLHDVPAATEPDFVDRLRAWLHLESLLDWAAGHAFVEVPALIVLIFLVRGVFLYFGQYFTIRCGSSAIRDLRSRLYESIAFQSLGFFHANSTGVILSRILSDVQRLERVTTMPLADLVRVSAMVPFLVGIAIYHEWRMSLVAFVALPLLGYPMVRLGRRLRRASTASQENMGRVTSILSEAISGVRVVQAFSMERYEIGRFRAALERMLSADLRAVRAQALAPAVMELLGAIVGAVLFGVAGWSISQQRLGAGDFTVVLGAFGMLFASVRRLNAIYAEMQTAVAAAGRVFHMMDCQRAIEDSSAARALAPFERDVRFEAVGFSYGDEPVLAGIELVLRKGETVALVGPSGSGKSSLVNLIPRFYDPTSGTISIDGTDLRSVTIDSLRAQIGLVTQETVLFDDTVRNNIAYGRADIPLERVIEAARASQAHEFIEQLPQGYDTPLGERGARLSLGQRQRISIARALLKDPPILILDEATSALDAESETLVQQALERLMRGRTSVVIAHRLATVRAADRILVLDAGRIVEQGAHRELLLRNGLYAHLHELQFREGPR